MEKVLLSRRELFFCFVFVLFLFFFVSCFFNRAHVKNAQVQNRLLQIALKKDKRACLSVIKKNSFRYHAFDPFKRECHRIV